MKHFHALVIMIFLLCVSNYAEASPIRYSITGGVDTEGYAFSGYVDIESDPTFYGRTPYYDIVSFLFLSFGGFNYGTSGELWWMSTEGSNNIGAGGGMGRFYSDYVVNFVGKENSSRWSNAKTGVWFTGVEQTIEAYSHLPEQIIISTSLMLGNTVHPIEWGPKSACYGIVLDRVGPVPEPTTIILFGTGLAGLAAVGRRRRK